MLVFDQNISTSKFEKKKIYKEIYHNWPAFLWVLISIISKQNISY